MSQLDPWKQAADIIQKQMDTLRTQLEAVTRERNKAHNDLCLAREGEARLTRERDVARESEARMRAALEGLLSRPVAKPGWSAEWDALVEAARAACGRRA